MASKIYRGFIIDPHPQGGYVVRRDGKVVTSQPSEEFAYKWVDEYKRIRAETLVSDKAKRGT